MEQQSQPSLSIGFSVVKDPNGNVYVSVTFGMGLGSATIGIPLEHVEQVRKNLYDCAVEAKRAKSSLVIASTLPPANGHPTH